MSTIPRTKSAGRQAKSAGSQCSTDTGRLPALDSSTRAARSVRPTSLRSGRSLKRSVAAWPGGSVSTITSNPGSLNSMKPRALLDLEQMLERELRAHRCPPKGPDPQRLQVHREVFGQLIEDFTTYKPILSLIRAEYEASLRGLRDEVNELRPLRAKLATADEIHAKEVAAVQESLQKQLVAKDAEFRNMQSLYQELLGEKDALGVQVASLAEELRKEAAKYNREKAARLMLVADMNELRTAKGGSALPMASLGDAAADLATAAELADVRLELEHTKELLRIARGKVQTNETAVPLVVHERALACTSKLETELDRERADMAALMEEYSAVTALCKETRGQRDMARTQAAELKLELEAAEKKLKNGVDKIESPQPMFQPRGMANSVRPVYLRWNKPVVDRQLSRRELRLLIKDIFNERVLHLSSSADNSPGCSLAEFVTVYLETRFLDEPTRKEWAYNIHHGCERHCARDVDIRLFHDIVLGRVDDAIYATRVVETERLKGAFQKLRIASDQAPLISVAAAAAVLVQLYPDKEADQQAALRQAVLADFGGEQQGECKAVFGERGERRLLEALWAQWDAERAAFVEVMKRKLHLAHSDGNVTRLQAEKVLRMVAGSQFAAHVCHWLAWAMPEPEASRAKHPPATVAISSLCDRLARGNVHPTVLHR